MPIGSAGERRPLLRCNGGLCVGEIVRHFAAINFGAVKSGNDRIYGNSERIDLASRISQSHNGDFVSVYTDEALSTVVGTTEEILAMRPSRCPITQRTTYFTTRQRNRGCRATDSGLVD